LFVSSVLCVFWYHSPNFLGTPRTPHAPACRLQYADSYKRGTDGQTQMRATSPFIIQHCSTVIVFSCFFNLTNNCLRPVHSVPRALVLVILIFSSGSFGHFYVCLTVIGLRAHTGDFRIL
jgi:hypothetical protein